MARALREKSSTGIYHIMFRGVNRQVIFKDRHDQVRFLGILREYKDICEFELYGYCLMGNHVHLLIKETNESISEIIKRLSSSYVRWYNSKYERCGHLFQERFKSEVVEDDTYFLTVLRYIHQNPVKANITKIAAEYEWSSYNEYIKKPKLVDIDFAFNYFSEDRPKAITSFVKFMNQDNEDQCLDIVEKVKLTDEAVRGYMRQLGILNISMLRQSDKEKRDYVLSQLKKLEGISLRQIERVTGISRGVINRA